MHRKQNTDLIPAYTELEKTLRSLRKIKKAENSIMADERQEKNGRAPAGYLERRRKTATSPAKDSKLSS